VATDSPACNLYNLHSAFDKDPRKGKSMAVSREVPFTLTVDVTRERNNKRGRAEGSRPSQVRPGTGRQQYAQEYLLHNATSHNRLYRYQPPLTKRRTSRQRRGRAPPPTTHLTPSLRMVNATIPSSSAQSSLSSLTANGSPRLKTHPVHRATTSRTNFLVKAATYSRSTAGRAPALSPRPSAEASPIG